LVPFLVFFISEFFIIEPSGILCEPFGTFFLVVFFGSSGLTNIFFGIFFSSCIAFATGICKPTVGLNIPTLLSIGL
tara:strand:+ start:526 stop:753 length:228 start_codon:yes stop_codon:yes gene_type:complete